MIMEAVVRMMPLLEGVYEPREVRASRSWKSKGTNSPLEHSKGTQSTQDLDFSPLRLIFNFYPLEVSDNICFKL